MVRERERLCRRRDLVEEWVLERERERLGERRRDDRDLG